TRSTRDWSSDVCSSDLRVRTAHVIAGARNRLSSLGIFLGGFGTEGLGVMPTGTIARLLIDKGFGFIRDEGGIEHFFHRSSVRGRSEERRVGKECWVGRL